MLAGFWFKNARLHKCCRAFWTEKDGKSNMLSGFGSNTHGSINVAACFGTKDSESLMLVGLFPHY